jgi:hypothetical protein
MALNIYNSYLLSVSIEELIKSKDFSSVICSVIHMC